MYHVASRSLCVTNVNSTEGLRKDELASLLEEHLNDNATTLRRDPTFNDYYDRTSSPTKRDAAPTLDGEVKTVVRKRRVIKVKSETDAYVIDGLEQFGLLTL